MKNQTFVVLMSGGKPVSLSTGVRLISGNVVLGCEVHTRSYDLGGFDHYLDMTGLGPKVEGWANSFFRPPVDIYQQVMLEKSLKQFEGSNSIEFKDLTSDNVFWYPDKDKGTHILMDERTHRQVRVSPVKDHLQKGFWTGIAAAYANTLENYTREENARIARLVTADRSDAAIRDVKVATANVRAAKSWGNPHAIEVAEARLVSLRLAIATANGYKPELASWRFNPTEPQEYWEPEINAFTKLYRKGVYVGFNPVPFTAGKPTNWFFHGPTAVRFKIPPPSSSEEYVTVENEKYMGLIPMPV